MNRMTHPCSPFAQRHHTNFTRLVLALLLCTCLLTPALAQSRKIVVISHRGEHLHHPENTLPAFQEAIRVGADFFELDVQTTADGKLVLSHDAKVDRRTNGQGEISKMT